MKKLLSFSLFAMIGFLSLSAGTAIAQGPTCGVMIPPSCRVRTHVRTLPHRHIAHARHWHVRTARVARHRW